MAPYHLHALHSGQQCKPYIVALNEAKRSLMTNDCKTLLFASRSALAQPPFLRVCIPILAGLLRTRNITDAISHVTRVSNRVLAAIEEAIYAADDGEIVDLLFGDLPHLHRFKPHRLSSCPLPCTGHHRLRTQSPRRQMVSNTLLAQCA